MVGMDGTKRRQSRKRQIVVLSLLAIGIAAFAMLLTTQRGTFDPTPRQQAWTPFESVSTHMTPQPNAYPDVPVRPVVAIPIYRPGAKLPIAERNPPN